LYLGSKALSELQRGEGEYSAEFQRARLVEIPNFLPPQDADRLARFLSEQMPLDWWYASTRAGATTLPVDIRLTPGADTAIAAARAAATAAWQNSMFSYSFLRTKSHIAQCGCVLCATVAALTSSDALELLECITGVRVSGGSEFFASWYRPGDFLSSHRDVSRGRKLGMVLQLTRGWRPEFGGLLNFVTDRDDGVSKVIVPQFNSACLFDLPHPSGSPHFVSHVAPNVQAHRIAVSGWYV